MDWKIGLFFALDPTLVAARSARYVRGVTDPFRDVHAKTVGMEASDGRDPVEVREDPDVGRFKQEFLGALSRP